MEQRETDGPANVTSMCGKFGTYQSDVVNNNRLKPHAFIKKRGQSRIRMQKISQSAICGLKAVKTRGCVFVLPDFYLSSSADFTVLQICSRINRSWNLP